MIAALGLAVALAAADELPPAFELGPAWARESGAALSPDEEARLQSALADRDRLDRTVWWSERRAQEHEAVFVRLWDALRAARDPLAAARAFATCPVTLPRGGAPRALDLNLTLTRPSATPGETLDAPAWEARLRAWHAAGWRLVQSEWHHAEFHRETTPPWSQVRVNLQAIAPDGSRHEWRGALRVSWADGAREGEPPAVGSVDASALDHLSRPAGPAFREVLNETFARGPGRGSTMLHAWDLDGDGRSDLILPGMNVVYWNRGGGRFRRAPLLAHPVEPDACGLFADLDGDGRTDYLCAAGTPPRLLFYRGGPHGTFPEPPVPATDVPLDLTDPSVISTGDVDGDGRLDVWVGQYRNPYLGGVFPSPYYDANDGDPAYLLRGDGRGHFTDQTVAAGLGARRNRRNYGASFLDLFGTGRMDLVTINDFAGVDVWRNTGGGRFAEATRDAVDEPANFGMGLAVDDFTGDGRLGLYVAGMGSTTMRRLAQMGLRPADGLDVTLSRTRMGYGSRLYLPGEPGRWRQPPWGAQVSRSGWSWGVVAFDPNLDGDRDLFVANGFISGTSAQDYCTRFWCHDVYLPREASPRLTRHLLALSTADVNRGEESWNGYEKKKFFLRTGASEFIEAAWPLGLALEEDCRNLVADDFDGDGRPDLALLAEDRTAPDAANPGASRFRLVVLRNELATRRHWIGVRIRNTGPVPPFGAVVTVRTAAGPRAGVVLTGDSWRSQQASVRHFGLGDAKTVEAVEVRWPDGRVARLDRPAVDRYLDVAPPAAAPAAPTR